MRIMAKVAARFTNLEGETFFIRAEDRMIMLTAPDWIAGERLFKLMEADGDVTVIRTAEQQSRVEKGEAPVKKVAKANGVK